jgi:thiol:disulfide interchange protein DsbD
MKNLTLFIALFIGVAIFGQHNPISFTTNLTGDTLQVDANIEKGWHLYSANLPHPNEGPLSTEFSFASDQIKIEGDIVESVGITEMDDAFGVEVIYFKDEAKFYIPVKAAHQEISITAPLTISYMVCNDATCIPFDVEVNVVF